MTSRKRYSKTKKTKKAINSRKTRKNKKEKEFLYHPDNPDKSFDVYINKNPEDTIPIAYSTVKDVKETIAKL